MIFEKRRFAVLIFEWTRPIPRSLTDEIRHEGRHNDASLGTNTVKDGVGNIARMIAQGEGVVVRKKDRCARNIEYAVHHAWRSVREINDNPESVQF